MGVVWVAIYMRMAPIILDQTNGGNLDGYNCRIHLGLSANDTLCWFTRTRRPVGVGHEKPTTKKHTGSRFTSVGFPAYSEQVLLVYSKTVERAIFIPAVNKHGKT